MYAIRAAALTWQGGGSWGAFGYWRLHYAQSVRQVQRGAAKGRERYYQSRGMPHREKTEGDIVYRLYADGLPALWGRSL